MASKTASSSSTMGASSSKLTLNDPIVSSFRPSKVFSTPDYLALPEPPSTSPHHFTSLDFDDAGHHLVTSGTDESIHLYDARTGRHQKQLHSKKYGVDLVRFTHRSSTVLYASTKGDDTIRYHSLHDNRYINYFRGHTKRVTTLQMNPVDDSFLSGAVDESVKLWDLRSPNVQVRSASTPAHIRVLLTRSFTLPCFAGHHSNPWPPDPLLRPLRASLCPLHLRAPLHPPLRRPQLLQRPLPHHRAGRRCLLVALLHATTLPLHHGAQLQLEQLVGPPARRYGRESALRRGLVSERLCVEARRAYGTRGSAEAQRRCRRRRPTSKSRPWSGRSWRLWTGMHLVTRRQVRPCRQRRWVRRRLGDSGQGDAAARGAAAAS